MKPIRLLCALGLGVVLCCPLLAQQVATVKGDRVNVRGQASLASERITQLNDGETVVILEEIAAAQPGAGEPTRWARIQLPSDTPVFVYAPYIDGTTKAVKVTRLNLRGGPGENYSVLGRIERGSVVKELGTTDNWMKIEPPQGAYAFVAMDFLEPQAAVAPRTAALTVAATPTTPPPVEEETLTVEVIESDPLLVATDPSAAPAETEVVEVAMAPTIAMADPAPVAEPTPPRVVYREGRVVYSRSIQAPTTYALESQETRRLINYLHTEQEGMNIKTFAGRIVLVTGEELLDARWPNTPILEVQDIRIAP